MNNIFKYYNLVPIGGLNNTNYLLNYYNTKYVLRIPNKDNSTNFLSENEIIKLMLNNNLTTQIIYHNKVSGIQLSKFLDDANITEHTPYDKNFISNLTKSLKTMHNLKCSNIFNPFDEIRNNISSLVSESFEFPSNFYTLIDKLNTLEIKLSKNIEYGLCHNDLNPSNVLYKDNKVYLIDFEYASMGDIYYDLAAFCWLLDDHCRDQFLKSYFGYCSSQILEKLNDYLFVVKMWGATWSYKKSFFSSKNYDFKSGGDIIINDLSKEQSG